MPPNKRARLDPRRSATLSIAGDVRSNVTSFFFNVDRLRLLPTALIALRERDSLLGRAAAAPLQLFKRAKDIRRELKL